MVRDAVKGATVAAVLLLVAAGWYAWRRQEQDAGGALIDWGDWSEWSPGSLADDVVSAADSVLGSGLDVIDDLTGGACEGIENARRERGRSGQRERAGDAARDPGG